MLAISRRAMLYWQAKGEIFVEIHIIDREHSGDINIKNEPFPLFGRMVPTYDGEHWGYTVERFAQTEEMCFPDENYDFDRMAEHSTFLGAYEGGKCIGLAIVQEGFFKYMYLYDLKISRAFRGTGAGRALLEKAAEVARGKGYRGIYTQGQDNNLGACLFYLKCGFVIGGLDTRVYTGTSQEGKRDIIFYLDR